MKPEEVRDLLPSYATGALGAEQAKQVEAELQADAELRQELAEWRVLRSVVADVGDDEPEFRPELIHDMHRRIDAYEDGRNAARVESQPKSNRIAAADTGALETWIEKLAGFWNATPFVAQVAVAAQFAALAVIIGFVSLGPSDDAGFVTASGGSAGVADGRSVSVVFQPEASFGEVQALLELTGGQIVAGPSGQNAYLLNLGDVDDAEVERLLETLRGNNAVVRFAAPLE